MHSSWKSRGGRGVLVFFDKFFWGGYLGLWENQGGGACFIAFLCGSFSKIFIGGTWGVPLNPPPPPVCIYGVRGKYVHVRTNRRDYILTQNTFSFLNFLSISLIKTIRRWRERNSERESERKREGERKRGRETETDLQKTSRERKGNIETHRINMWVSND